jgi:putative tryptophan/tyrosine transport system substrate-binding protein
MRRREFITGLGAAAWPLAARAEQTAVPVIGYLNDGTTLDAARENIPAFRQGLAEIGYVEGRNVAIEYRATDGEIDRLPALAADLVSRRVAVIAGLTSTLAVRAAKNATATIPIVFAIGGDPVKLGLVASFSRPGGNVTGVSGVVNELGPKRLALLHDLLPNATTMAALVNPTNPNAQSDADELLAAAHSLGLNLVVFQASNGRDIDRFFATLITQRVSAFMLTGDPLFGNRLDQLIVAAASHAIPAMFTRRAYPVAGGLMSYGANLADAYRQVGLYTGQVLKGTKPADLPVIQSTKFEFVINLKTAKALGLTIPPSLLALADEVIE